mmetsp:Transcript_23508/g.51592  ORF Transcript_23508/g.51592 Transcript_23508/m.51592 type:complete len:88 (-) Transcript_23508:673-936(-)
MLTHQSIMPKYLIGCLRRPPAAEADVYMCCLITNTTANRIFACSPPRNMREAVAMRLESTSKTHTTHMCPVLDVSSQLSLQHFTTPG